MSTCSVPCSPTGRHPGPRPAPVLTPGPRRRRSRDAGQAAALARSTSCEPGTANAEPSLPVRPDAGRRPRRPRTTGTSTRCARPGRPATPSHSGVQSARTGRRRRRGHRRPVRADTWMQRTPGHRTPGHRTPGHRTPGRWMSARPAGQTSPRRDRERGQGNDRPSRRPDILATGDHPLGGPTWPVSRRLGRSAAQDGSAVTAPAPRP
jgi:hypothetical protein